jgi:hypothetical protein
MLLDRLTTLARRERGLRLGWGLSRWLALVVGMLMLSCAFDWLVDLWDDTPAAARLFLAALQIGLAAYFFYKWVLQPVRTGLGLESMALWVEGQEATHGHRLISAVQLNLPDAERFGMSTFLIDAMTEQAETTATDSDFTSLLDRRRIRWTWMFLIPALLIPLLLWLIAPAPVAALLQRQFGSDVRIPRGIALAAQTAELWPSGEPVTLRFLVAGNWSDQQTGHVEVIPDGQVKERYELKYLEPGPTEGQAYFAATVPASSTPFVYRAWLFDGRTYDEARIRFAPRPVLVAWEAWLKLPSYVGMRPNGEAYELVQSKGDLQPVPGTAARIRVVTQAPVVEAVAELLGPYLPDVGAPLALPAGPVSAGFLLTAQRHVGWTPSAAGPLVVVQRTPLALAEDGKSAVANVSLPLNATAYRILVRDANGFTNRPVPRRAVTFKPDEPPQVALLPERFTTTAEGRDDLNLEGMPVPLGRSIRIGYVARDDFVLSSARLRYRINEEPWQQMSLTETGAPSDNAFDVQTGAFARSAAKDQVPFHAMPPGDATTQLGRNVGGGRFDFQTRAIPGLKLGDVIEYYLEVADRHADPNRMPGRSPVRRKTVVTEAQFVEWVVQAVQQENRLRQLERQQRRVFEPVNP